MWTNIYSRRRKDELDEAFHALNKCYENIKLTIEISPSKFLDTQLINIEGEYIAKVHRKESKIPIHWSSKIPKRCKRNTITKNVASNMKEEIQTIRKT